jgi:hypothetical protein
LFLLSSFGSVLFAVAPFRSCEAATAGLRGASASAIAINSRSLSSFHRATMRCWPELSWLSCLRCRAKRAAAVAKQGFYDGRVQHPACCIHRELKKADLLIVTHRVAVMAAL